MPTACCLSLVPAFMEISLGFGFSSSQANFFEDLSSVELVAEEAELQSRTVPYLASALRQKAATFSGASVVSILRTESLKPVAPPQRPMFRAELSLESSLWRRAPG